MIAECINTSRCLYLTFGKQYKVEKYDSKYVYVYNNNDELFGYEQYHFILIASYSKIRIV